MALDVTDYSTNTNDLTNSGVTESNDVPAGLSGGSLSAYFDGSSYAYVSDANQTGLHLKQTWTVEAWLKPTKVDAWQPIASKSYVGGWPAIANREWWADIRAIENRLEAIIFEGALYPDDYNWDGAQSDSTTGFVVNEWHHWVWVYNQGDATTHVRFYKDGVYLPPQDPAATHIGDPNEGTASFMLGKWDGDETATYKGYMKDVRIWNDVRTSTEIANNYEAPLNGDEDNLVAYYPFEAISSGGRTVIGSARVEASGRVVAGARIVHPGRTAV